MDTLSFEHALHLVDGAARAVRDHAEAVLTDRGDPHLAPLLFLHASAARGHVRLSVGNDEAHVFGGERPEPYALRALQLLRAHFERQKSLTTKGRKVITELIGDRA